MQGPFHVPPCLLFVEERQIKGRRRAPRTVSRCSLCSRYWVILLFPVFFDSGRCSLQNNAGDRLIVFLRIALKDAVVETESSLSSRWEYLTDSIYTSIYIY